jgi:hypothetical protein
MSLAFSYVPSTPIEIPGPKLNGGLYTGEPFLPGAPWANVPVVPETGYMIHTNLRSANPPHQALTQYPGNNRPGNNHQNMPGVQIAANRYGIMCNKPVYDFKMAESYNKTRFNKYYYL